MDKIALLKDCRQTSILRERCDARAVSYDKCIDYHVNSIRSDIERVEGGRDIVRSPDFEWRDFDAERRS